MIKQNYPNLPLDDIRFDDLLGMESGEDAKDVPKVTEPITDEATKIASPDEANSLSAPFELLEALENVLADAVDPSCSLDVFNDLVNIPSSE